jgi:hypothetical protein
MYLKCIEKDIRYRDHTLQHAENWRSYSALITNIFRKSSSDRRMPSSVKTTDLALPTEQLS